MADNAINAPQRNYCLDFMKMIAATIILFCHFQQVTGARYENHIRFSGGSFDFSAVVDFFFLVSGFLSLKYIAIIQDGQPFHVFYLRKARRLLPLVCISVATYEALALCYQSIYGTNLLDFPLDLFGTVLASLGLQAGWVFTGHFVNNPTWYCSVLLLCYAVFYIGTRLAQRWRVRPVYFYLLMILLGCGIVTYQIQLPFFNFYSSFGYYSFFTGVVLALALTRVRISKSLVAACVAVIAVVAVLLIRQHELVSADARYLMAFLVHPALLIIAQSPLAKRIFTHPCWGVLSQISFSVYIWHLPLLMGIYILMAVLRVDIDFSKPVSMYGFTLAAWLVGAVSYYCLEKPLDRLIGRWLQRFQNQ